MQLAFLYPWHWLYEPTSRGSEGVYSFLVFLHHMVVASSLFRPHRRSLCLWPIKMSNDDPVLPGYHKKATSSSTHRPAPPMSRGGVSLAAASFHGFQDSSPAPMAYSSEWNPPGHRSTTQAAQGKFQLGSHRMAGPPRARRTSQGRNPRPSVHPSPKYNSIDPYFPSQWEGALYWRLSSFP